MRTIEKPSTIAIDRSQALELLDRAVAEKGAEYVYQAVDYMACKYQDAGAPSCIVGHALAYAGVAIDDLELMDDAANFGDDMGEEGTAIDNLCGIASAAAQLPFTLTRDALAVFTRAQQAQDAAVPWGEAVSIAKAVGA